MKAKKVGIAIDDWKLKIFKSHLKKANLKFKLGKGVTSDTLMLYVHTYEELLGDLQVIIQAANDEAFKRGRNG